MLELVPQAVAQDAGPFTFPGARIEGVGDITQFIVKAAPTQTNNLVEIQANDGSQFVTITGLGETILDVTSTEAFLVRKAGDTGDVFAVDTDTPSINIFTNMAFQQASTISTTAGNLIVDSASYTILRDNTIIGPTITTPDGTLHIHTGSAGAVSANANYDDLVIESSGAGGFSILVPDASNAQWTFGSPSDNVGGIFRWNYDALLMGIGSATPSAGLAFYAGNFVEYMRIQDDGLVGIGISTGMNAQVHIDQSTDDASIAVLTLDQADFSEEFVRFKGQSHDGVLTESLVEYGDEASSAGFAWIKVFIVDDNNQIADQAAYVLAYTLSA